MEAAKDVSISVVVPCYNEHEVVETAYSRLTNHLTSIAEEYELIFVNDGSSDDTLAILLKLANSDPRLRVINLARNFGQAIAVSAGVQAALGKAVVLIDADMQDPPEEIVRMIEMWRQGYDVVYGVRRHRDGEHPLRLWCAKVYYRVLDSLSEIRIPLDTGEFRLMDRRVVDVINSMPERHRFIRGLVSWAGYKQGPLYYERAKRFAGVTKYPLRKVFAVATDGIVSFSARPLRVATTFGFLVSFCAVIGIAYAVFLRLFTGNWVSGWTFLVVSILFLGGVQLVCMGIIGEYVGRIYDESKRRPLYVSDELTPKPNSVADLATTAKNASQ
jgi:glycosyltransferase involved in cell wall biosynthesis